MSRRGAARAIREAAEARVAAERCALDYPCPTCLVRQGQRCKPAGLHLPRLDLGAVKARKEEQRARYLHGT